MKRVCLISALLLAICFGSVVLSGQNNLLVTDYGINQYDKLDWSWKNYFLSFYGVKSAISQVEIKDWEHHFFYEDHLVYRLPKYSFSGSVLSKLPGIGFFWKNKYTNEADVMNEVTIAVARYYKNNPKSGNFELRLTHDMNSLSYGIGNIGYQQWSQKYHAAAQRGIFRAKQALNLHTIGYGGSNGGLMMVNGILRNSIKGYTTFDALILDEPQVLTRDFEVLTKVMNPGNITLFNYKNGLNGNFRAKILRRGMISQPEAAAAYPGIRFYNFNPSWSPLKSHIYAADHQYEYMRIRRYDHQQQRYRFFPNSRPSDIVNYEFYRISKNKQPIQNTGGVDMSVEVDPTSSFKSDPSLGELKDRLLKSAGENIEKN